MTETSAAEAKDHRPPAYGLALIAAAVVSVGGMMVHPSPSSHRFAEVVAEMADMGPLSGAVHGLMVATSIAMIFGLQGYTRGLPRGRTLAEAALCTYAVGVVAMFLAVLMSGWIAPELAGRYAGASGERLEGLRGLLLFAGTMNQACAKIGSVAYAVAIVLWSLPLATRRGAGAAAISTGVLGLVLGTATALAIPFGLLKLDVHGMLAVVAWQGVWSAAIGFQLLRRRRG